MTTCISIKYIMNLSLKQNSSFFQVASPWNFVLQYHKTAHLFPNKTTEETCLLMKKED